MPLVPSDPATWSLNMYRVSNYFVGSWRTVIDYVSCSSADFGFAVASSVAVVYDWGEQDRLWKGLLISLC